MLGVWRNALPIFLLAIFLLSVSWRTETPEKKGYLRGNVPSDLRADPGGEQPLKSNLKFADWFFVRSEERTRSLVVAADAQKESVRQSLLKFVDEAAAQTTGDDSSKVSSDKSKESTQKTAPTAPAKPQPPPGVKAKTAESRSKASSPAKSATPVDTSQEQKSAAKSPSILQMLEGRETELMIAAAIAATFFLIGWICGGHYSLRRDRRRRTKIRF
jgi:hypothetical protein